MKTKAKKRWTPQEVETLKELYRTTHTVAQIAERLGIPTTAVYQKAHKLGLPLKPDPNIIGLDVEQRGWLRANFPHIRTELCAMRLGISHRSVVRLARKMGLEKTAQFRKECQAFTAKKARESHLKNGTYPPKGVVNENLKKGAAFRYQPGHPSTRKPKAI